MVFSIPLDLVWQPMSDLTGMWGNFNSWPFNSKPHKQCTFWYQHLFQFWTASWLWGRWDGVTIKRNNRKDLTWITFQIMVDMSNMGIPVYLHEILTMKTVLDVMPNERCPLFAHADIDVKKDKQIIEDHVYVPSNRLFSRWVYLLNQIKAFKLCSLSEDNRSSTKTNRCHFCS